MFVVEFGTLMFSIPLDGTSFCLIFLNVLALIFWNCLTLSLGQCLGNVWCCLLGAAFGANFGLYLNKQQLVALYLKIRFGLPVSVFFFIAFCKPIGGTL